MNPEAAHCAIRLRAAVSGLARQLRPASAGLSTAKLTVLGQLHHGGPMTPTELAARERVKLQSLTRLLAELEADGLLTRAPHEADARQSVLALTTAGRTRLKAVARLREASLEAAIDTCLSAADIAALQKACDLIDVITAQLDAPPPSAARRRSA